MYVLTLLQSAQASPGLGTPMHLLLADAPKHAIPINGIFCALLAKNPSTLSHLFVHNKQDIASFQTVGKRNVL